MNREEYDKIKNTIKKVHRKYEFLEDFEGMIDEAITRALNAYNNKYEARISTLSCRIMENLIKNKIRDDFRLKRQTETVIESIEKLKEYDKSEKIITDNYDLEKNVINKMYVETLLSKLTTEERELIKMFFFEELSANEISKIKDINRTTIYKKINKIINKLQSEI